MSNIISSEDSDVLEGLPNYLGPKLLGQLRNQHKSCLSFYKSPGYDFEIHVLNSVEFRHMDEWDILLWIKKLGNLLHSHGEKRHAHDNQVQDVEGVTTERAFVQESAICGHLESRTRSHKVKRTYNPGTSACKLTETR